MTEKKLDLVLLWHLHQPDYRDHANGEFTLPWVYLHALKDYSDMVWHLERHPEMHAVVNLVPVLLDQIEDYAEQFASGRLRDPLLRLLAAPDLQALAADQRRLIFESCFRSNQETMIEPFPPYRRLQAVYRTLAAEGEGALLYLSAQYLSDLLTWYHLSWTGESARRNSESITRLMAQGAGYDHADRHQLFDEIGRLIKGLIPRYRALAESGQIELSMTPHGHPLAPLLIDFATAREALPDIRLPQAATYPDGRSRVGAHIASAIASHTRRFGAKPAGVWPAEGALSSELLEVLAEGGASWVAGGEKTLANSLRVSPRNTAASARRRSDWLYRPYRLRGADGPTCFFRDDRLSDLIGFEYRRWHGRDGALDFVRELEDIVRRTKNEPTPLVSVILDGENAWEYYPYNGHYFLSELYQILQSHAAIRTTTYRDYLAREGGRRVAELPALCAGSWVYGTFSTWIGDHDKNHAWDLLCEAKQSYDLALGNGNLTDAEREAAERQLGDCESSDWFWWFGDYNPQASVASFDRLFRAKLENLYRLLKLPAPAQLGEPISRGGGRPEVGGTMRRTS